MMEPDTIFLSKSTCKASLGHSVNKYAQKQTNSTEITTGYQKSATNDILLRGGRARAYRKIEVKVRNADLIEVAKAGDIGQFV